MITAISVVAAAALAQAVGPAAAAVRACQAERLEGPPASIDGRPAAAILDPFVDGAGRPAPVSTRAAVAFDAQHLYVVVECAEPHMAGLRAQAQGRDANVFADDCLEIFIAPGGDGSAYHHFAANPGGGTYEARGRDEKWNAPWTAQASSGPDHWMLRVAIPFAALGVTPADGTMWRFNVSRQRQAGGQTELSSWSNAGGDFHQVARFGWLLFDDRYAACLESAILEPWRRRTADLSAGAEGDIDAMRGVAEILAAARQALAPLEAAMAAGGPGSFADFLDLLGRGQSALAQLDDAQALADWAWQRRQSAAAMRPLAAPGEPAIVYVVPAVTNHRILPAPQPPPTLSRTLELRACRGEYEPASFVVYALDRALVVEATATALEGTQAPLAPRAVDLRVVKCWYQAGEGGHYPVNRGVRVLMPELLLHDDDLVRVDHGARQNHVKLAFPDGSLKWLWISSSENTPEEADVSAAAQPIRDAPALRPVSIAPWSAKQFWVTVHVPADAAAGTYRGAVELREADRLLATLAIDLEVLPFDLAPNPLESSLYFHWGLNLQTDGPGTVTHHTRHVMQFKAELANLLAHGVDNPTVCVRFQSGQLPLELTLRREVGMPANSLYYLSAGVGTPLDTVRRILETARSFGHTDVYFYGHDEAQGDALSAQRPAWEAIRAAGGKVFVAGYRGSNFPLVGDIQDLLVCAGEPNRAEAALWHSRGHKIFCYAYPQAGIEEPETYRRNFGLLLADRHYDGAMTYIHYGGWNDFNIGHYRQHNFVYPTADGVIDTIQWEGYREALDDLRYLATLRAAVARARDAGGEGARRAEEAQAFLDAMDVTEDLDLLRARMIDWTLELAR